MPKIINLPPAPPAPPSYKVGQSLWFSMDPTDPNAEIRSCVVKAIDGKELSVQSGNDQVTLEIGYDKIMTEPPGQPGPVGAPVGAPGPARSGDAPAGTPIGFTSSGAAIAIGDGVKFKSSLGVETGAVQGFDEKNGDIWVLKPNNLKRTRVTRDSVVEVVPAGTSQVAANVAPPPVEAQPEVVTPTVVLPPVAAPVPVVPPTVQPAVDPPPAPAASVPAVRPTAAVSTHVQYDNVKGEVFDDPDMIQMPRLLIAQGVKDHEKLGFTKGSIYLGLGEDPAGWICLGKSDGKVGSRTMPGVEFCVVEMRGYWVEQVPYETEKADGTLPLIAHTQAELAQLTPKAQYEFGREARFMLAIRKPEGVESDQFRYPIAGDLWALATFKAARTGFKAFVTPINTRISKLGGGKPPETWRFVLHAEVIEGEKNIFGKPIVVCKGEWPAEVSAELRTYAPA